MSEVPDHLVYKGFWINHSFGTILGATLTTDPATGNVIIALLAILVSIGISHLWNLYLFGYHQLRADGQKKHAFYRQQQALFRTLPPPDSLFVDLIRLASLWHSRVPKAFSQSLVPLLLALIFWLGSVTAGISSSFVVSSNNVQVLVSSPGCGYLKGSSQISKNGVALRSYYVALEQTIEEEALYAKSCYLKSSVASFCHIYVQPSIKFSSEVVRCPFSPSICLGDGELGLALDTGLLDANQDFGINVKSGEAVKVRYKTTCAPIQVAGRYNISDIARPSFAFPKTIPGEQKVAFYYGPPTELLRDEGRFGDYTFAFSSYRSALSVGYSLLEAELSNFQPIPELQRNDADVALFVIAFGYQTHSQPINDPVFSAHQEEVVVVSRNDSEIAFEFDYPGGAIACADQVQFCIPSDSGRAFECTDLGGAPTDSSDILPRASKIQRAVIEQFLHYHSSISDNVHSPSSTIQADASRIGSTINYIQLPDDQWAIEVKGLFGFFLSEVQNNLANYARGVKGDPWLEEWLSEPPESPEGQYLCRSMKMVRSGGFVNVNVLALVLIIAWSVTLVVVDMTILKLVVFTNKVQKRLSPRIDRWIQDGVLQLQRRVYEEAGEGRWTRSDQEISLTVADELFSDLAAGNRPPEYENSTMGAHVAMNSTTGDSVPEHAVRMQSKVVLCDIECGLKESSGPCNEELPEELQPAN